MAPSRAEWDLLTLPNGPVHVQHEDGTLVDHVARGQAQPVESGRTPESAADLKIILSDPGRPDRSIPGEQVSKIIAADPGVIVVVDDDVPAETGVTTGSRGNEPPKVISDDVQSESEGSSPIPGDQPPARTD